MTTTTAKQLPTIRCDCGRQAKVTRTGSPYEFDWCCTCGAVGFIAWAEKDPPPLFVDEDESAASNTSLPFD